MQYFLAKTDPETYSLDDLKKDKETVWDGVHNYQAINFLKTMKKHDRVFIYHSGGEAAIVGLAEVISDPRENTKDPRKSWVVDMKYLKTFPQHITLKEIKESNKFGDWLLVRQGRLSTMAAPDAFVEWIKGKGVDC